MSECNHDCGSCSADCASRQPASFLEPLNPQSTVKKVIGVVSGKGGVGKSLVTSLMACKMRARNHRVGILDADITGPSIPKAFGVHETVGVTENELMIPCESQTGIQMLSSNLILEHETDPVIWRGPIVGGVPIIGLVENMSYLLCPDCGRKISVFGESKADEVAKEYGIPMLAKLPIDPKIADSVDQGVVEYVESPWLDEAADIIEKM